MLSWQVGRMKITRIVTSRHAHCLPQIPGPYPPTDEHR